MSQRKIIISLLLLMMLVTSLSSAQPYSLLNISHTAQRSDAALSMIVKDNKCSDQLKQYADFLFNVPPNTNRFLFITTMSIQPNGVVTYSHSTAPMSYEENSETLSGEADLYPGKNDFGNLPIPDYSGVMLPLFDPVDKERLLFSVDVNSASATLTFLDRENAVESIDLSCGDGLFYGFSGRAMYVISFQETEEHVN